MGQFFFDTIEEAVHLLYAQFEREGYQRAAKLLTEAVNNGDPDACYFLGRCLLGNEFMGDYAGFEEDEEKAVMLFKKSANGGSAVGILGSLRIDVLDSVHKPSLPKAFKEVLKKAEAGHPFCQVMIGHVYFWGDIFEIEDIEYSEKSEADMVRKCIPWYEKAIASGYTIGSANLKEVYNGECEGVKADKKKYEQILKRCAEIGDPYDEELYADFLLEKGKNTEALRLYESSVQKGNPDAWYDIGLMYDEGIGVNQDEAYALTCFEKAAVSGYELAQECMGKCYYFGWNGMSVDFEKAFYWLNLAAEQEAEGVYPLLGMCYLKGQGTQQDYDTAMWYFENADDDSDDTHLVQYGLGMIYVDGLGVPEDINEGAELLKKSADAGNEEAAALLARFKKGVFSGWKRR